MMNLFLSPFNTPHGTVPFHKINLAVLREAILLGIEEEEKEIDAIIHQSETPNFKNTILALEQSGKTLDRAWTVLSNLLGCHTSDELEALAQTLMPKVSKLSNDVQFNVQLFQRIKQVYESKPQLDAEESKLLKDVYDGFLRRGVGLPDDKKEQLRKISLELSKLTLQFSQNVLKEQNRFSYLVTREEEIEGMPELQKEEAARLAADKGKKGWMLTLQAPCYNAVITFVKNRSLRKKLFMAQNTLCTHNNEYNNVELVRKIVNYRLEYARILGYDCFADYVLQLRMVENTSTVIRFFNRLIRSYKAQGRRDFEDIREYARQKEGETFCLKPWDFSYYSHLLQLEKYQIDSEILRPYFELSRVKTGIFSLAKRLYGITFKRKRNISVYQKDVEAYEVLDKEGSYLAVLYLDFFPREDKKSGAWTTFFQGQSVSENGDDIRPHVSLVMNFTKPTPSKPSLLSLGEVSTFLHEFGHALHEIFSKCRFESMSGTNVYWDFVELPSQVMENFALEKDFLKTFARHYQTGEPLPDELIQRIKDSSTYNAAYSCLQQVGLGMLDMAYYTLNEPLTDDVIHFEKKAWKRVKFFPQKLKTCMSVRFNHIMTGGYAAGYYSYKWAEVLDADAFALFKEKGIFNREVAESFRREILQRGGTLHPHQLYLNFRKKEPSVHALLVRDGIKKETRE